WPSRRPRARARHMKLVSLLAGMLLASGTAAQSGEQVYNETCSACHAAGLLKAPKFGSRAEWGPRIGMGQAHVTAHAWGGVGNMPPKGGNEALTLEQFARAAAYMARAAGGDWKEPDGAMLERIRAEAQKSG